jgi:hypothetical protein
MAMPMPMPMGPSPSANEYCADGGMMMMRNGFPTGSAGGPPACVTVLFEGWVITNATQEALAFIGVFLFAVFHEFVIHCRRKLVVNKTESQSSLLLNSNERWVFCYHMTDLA